jgi:hypothetical protein
MAILRDELGSCQTSSGDGNQFLFVNAEDFTDIEVEEDPSTCAVMKPETANCVDLLRSDSDSCSETCQLSFDGENQVIGVKDEEVADTEEDGDPQSITFQTVRTESESTVSEHLRTHNGKRAFCCEACNKAFDRQSHLVRHKQIHSGERPFSCDVCNKSFIERCTLMTHKRIHSGERPFSCDKHGYMEK